MKQSLRKEIHSKFDGKCAYCGNVVIYNKMQVDHIEPIFRGYENKDLEKYGREKGKDSIENYNPSCARCNRYKSTFSLEELREQIGLQTQRLLRDSAAYRLALDFGLIKETNNKVLFHYEKT